MRSSLPSVLAIVFAWVLCVIHAALLRDSTEQVEQDFSTVPSLKLHVMLKGKNVQIHGQSVFDVFAKPVVSNGNTELRYDGFSSFVEGDTKFMYTVVNGVSYVVEKTRGKKTSAATPSVRCYSSGIPFGDMLSSLNKAVAIPSASVNGEQIRCPYGSLYQTSLGDADFVLCASGASGFTVYGIDMTVDVEYLSRPIKNISTLTPGINVDACPVVIIPTTVTPTATALLTGEAISSTSARNLQESEPAEIKSDTCECKSTPRPCIFLHGSGNPTEEAELQDTPKLTKRKYGEMGDHAPCCTTIKYAVLNTNDRGWTNATLQQKYCDFSLSMSNSSDLSTRTVSDTIVVTHSMGGLVMAGAIANGMCKFAKSTSWVSLSPPMAGTMAADYIQDLCDGNITGLKIDMMDMLGLVKCPASTSRKYLGYQNGNHTTPALNAAYNAAQKAYRKNVYAAICSRTYRGVLSNYYAKCVIGGKMIPHKSKENDGLVEFESCLGGLDAGLFGNSYRDRFYAGKLNHADTAFLTRDGIFSDAQKPFKWFECLL
ncbi:hypothetical protein PHMEG_00027798 [Phytophthora megakarya]|uniref:GPI inositol-deacylase n=1 Tax=Phytophthora megakarya TaxID=4795 RepID=A0A225V6I8_9STRA|nr:hypothetical protein PHMEG_00027798 [Phytophthora megakarya]